MLIFPLCDGAIVAVGMSIWKAMLIISMEAAADGEDDVSFLVLFSVNSVNEEVGLLVTDDNRIMASFLRIK